MMPPEYDGSHTAFDVTNVRMARVDGFVELGADTSLAPSYDMLPEIALAPNVAQVTCGPIDGGVDFGAYDRYFMPQDNSGHEVTVELRDVRSDAMPRRGSIVFEYAVRNPYRYEHIWQAKLERKGDRGKRRKSRKWLKRRPAMVPRRLCLHDAEMSIVPSADVGMTLNVTARTLLAEAQNTRFM